jgi:hypothetical protein
MASSAAFYTGSFNFSTEGGFGGFIATQQTVIDAVAWGTVSGSAAVVQNPKLTVAAGVNLPVNFTALIGTGSIVAYK